MSTFKSSFMQEAQARGFIYQGTDPEALDALMAKKSIAAYIGFDATASSFHVGNLVQIMQLRLLQKHGHKPLVLMGDGTTLIGDPSGKDDMRQLLTPEQIEVNLQSLQKVFASYLTFGTGGSEAVMLRNSEWLLPLNYIDFLREVGRHFSVNRMLTFEAIKQRLDRDQPLSFLEFNYMIFQAYDFLELYNRYECVLQLGGSDQWGNILNGVDLTRRVTGKEVFGLTAPLITTSDGKKMGKTAQGALWLNAEMKSPFEFWQFWRNTQDADVGRFLRLFTDLPLDEIKRLEALKDSEINEAKKILADEVTKLCHGSEEVQKARTTAETLFASGEGGLENLPTVVVSEKQLVQGVSLLDLFRETTLCPSNAEARRLIRGAGARLNDVVIENENALLTPADFDTAGVAKLSAGRKRHALVKREIAL
jgi:tyrosyl-tRNA synthetase